MLSQKDLPFAPGEESYGRFAVAADMWGRPAGRPYWRMGGFGKTGQRKLKKEIRRRMRKFGQPGQFSAEI